MNERQTHFNEEAFVGSDVSVENMDNNFARNSRADNEAFLTAEVKKANRKGRRKKAEELSAIASDKEREVAYYGENLPYVSGFPVFCNKYAIICENGYARVALRFFNAGDIIVTGLRFTLTQIDANGDVIASAKLNREGLFAESGTEFSVADAEVDPACVAVKVKIDTIVSQSYEYVIGKEGEAKLRYGVDSVEKDCYFKENPYCKVKKRGRGYALIAFLAVLCIAAAVVLFVWGVGVLDKTVDRSTGGSATFSHTIYIGGVDVEA